MPIDAVIRRLRKEPWNCSTRDILDMSPVMIRNLLCESDDDEDRQMASNLPLQKLPLPGKRPAAKNRR